jgi:hypothetical protein
LKDLESQVEVVAGGLTGQERAERVRDLLSAILEAERVECALVERTGAVLGQGPTPAPFSGSAATSTAAIKRSAAIRDALAKDVRRRQAEHTHLGPA